MLIYLRLITLWYNYRTMSEEYTDGATAPKGQSLAVPIAIIVGFGLIAGAIFFSGNKVSPTEGTTVVNPDQVVDTNNGADGTLNPISETDHIAGNPNAPIMIVEYSDFDCPFCKVFHETMNQIMDEYGVSGQVAWTYRHLPLENLHPSAAHIAEASECVASLGGNEAFWTFADQVFGERQTNALTNVSRLPEFASVAGVDEAAYQACIQSGEKRAEVEEDFNNAVSLGIGGTPHSFLVVGDQSFPLNGARPYNEVKNYIDSLLAQMQGAEPTADVEEGT